MLPTYLPQRPILPLRHLPPCLLAVGWLVLLTALPAIAQRQPVAIPIFTTNTALVLQTDAEQRLNMVYLGAPLAAGADYVGAAGA